MNKAVVQLVLLIAALSVLPGAAYAQSMPSSYSDYYNKQLQTLNRPVVSPRQYTIDKYYYHNPAVSPYLNLTRRSGAYTNNYYQYVKPEEQRRAAAQAPHATGAAPVSAALPSNYRPPAAGASSGGYQNHWYNGRAAMGLK